jgi:hypothetical protein
MQSDALVLCGAPNRLAAFLPESMEEGMFPIRVEGAALASVAAAPCHALVYRSQALPMQQIRVSLPRSTPPGSYPVSIDFGKYRRVVRLEVQPLVRSQILPRRSFVSASPGAKVSFGFTIANTGNVPFELFRTSTFILAHSEALCRSLVNTASQEPRDDGERILDRFAEELRAHTGGVAAIRVTAGDRVVHPEQVRNFEAILRVPTEIEVGKQYWGFWSVYEDKAYRLQVRVAPSEEGPGQQSEPNDETGPPVAVRDGDSNREA